MIWIYENFMKYLRRLGTVNAIFIFASLPVLANEETIPYTVQPRDNLSTILQKHSLKPIYGKDGSLAEVLKLNPKKQDSGGDKIYVGEIIYLPKSMLKDSKASAGVEVKSTPAKKPLPTPQKISENKPLPQITNSIEPSSPIPAILPIDKPENFKLQIDEVIPQKQNVQRTVRSFILQFNDFFSEYVENTSSNRQILDTFGTEIKSSNKLHLIPQGKLTLAAKPLPQQPTPRVADDSVQEQASSQTLMLSYQERNAPHEIYRQSPPNCVPYPSCKNRLWEVHNRCCDRQKTYFLFYENHSPFSSN